MTQKGIFDVLFEIFCPNFDPLMEPNLTLVEYLMDHCNSLASYLNGIREEQNTSLDNKGLNTLFFPDINKLDKFLNKNDTTHSSDNSYVVFLSRLTLILNKILKVGAKNQNILNKLMDAKLVGTIFKNCENYATSRKHKHMLVEMVQLHKNVLISKNDKFMEELFESSVLFRICEANSKRKNLLYCQILEFCK